LNDIAAALGQRIEARSSRVGVIGLGYVGLPLAVAFAEAGFPVIGVDADADRIGRLGRGSSPVEDVPDHRLAPLVRGKRLVVTGSIEALGEADAILICVPTPLSKSKEPDITAHPEFDAGRLVQQARLVLDTRNLTGGLGPHPHVIRL